MNGPGMRVGSALLCAASAAIAATAAVAPTALADFPARGTAPALPGTPGERSALGEAFLEAWLAFRDGLDSAPRADVHPALFGAWFSSMPRFLARDAARLATNPLVALAAGRRLAAGARDEDRRLLGELEERAAGTLLSPDFRGLRIAAKDREALRESLDRLGDPVPLVALEAACGLAAGGDGRGLEHLRRAVERGDRASGAAARALGRYGAEGDMARLAGARGRGAGDEAIDAGVGELALRHLFPVHGGMLERRDPSGVRFGVERGMYDAWLGAVGRAAAAGARDSAALLARVERERAAAQGWEAEPRRRELGLLVDFWNAVDASVRVMRGAIAWPGDFREALRRLRTPDPAEPLPERFSGRFAAAIAVLAVAGPALDYERLARPAGALRFVSPGGDRSADGSFATAWRGGEGAELVFDVDPRAVVRSLWIASRCPGAPGASARGVRISGARGGAWAVAHRFADGSGYFEEVPLGAARGGRISVAIAGAGPAVACISEIRAGVGRPLAGGPGSDRIVAQGE